MCAINIGIADDHCVFIRGLRACLASDTDLKVIIESNHGRDLLEQLREKTVDIVLMDIKMPVMDGISTTYAIKEKYPLIRVLALSTFDDENYIIKMMQAGANGFLVKSSSAQEILRAVHAVYQTGYFVNEHLSLALVRQFRHTNDTPDHPHSLNDLNTREKEVLKLVCEQYSNDEIAKKLYVSTRTVEGYRSKLIEKSGAKNVAGLVMFAVRKGIVQC
jgi:DNA-binding NarL/FixJ family response regulator